MNPSYAFVQTFAQTTGARPLIYPRDIDVVHNPGSGDFDRPKRNAKMGEVPPRLEGSPLARWGGKFLPSASAINEQRRYAGLAAHLSPGAMEKLEHIELTNIRRGARTTGAGVVETVQSWAPTITMLLVIWMLLNQRRMMKTATNR